jgi:PAS domain S-box-containing protein
MSDTRKTKAQLLSEVETLRRHIADLQAMAAERQRAEEARRESEERYRTLVEHTFDFVIESSLDGRFLYVSSDYTDVLGYEPEELLGRDIFALMHPDDTPTALAAFVRGVERFSSEQAVFRYRHKNGEWRWFEGTGRPFRTATGEVRVMVVSRDITERKQAEEALQEEAQVSTALVRVGQEMISSLSAPVILNYLCQLTAQELESECSYTFLRQPEEDAFTPVAHWGDTPEQWEALRVLHLPSQTLANLLARLEREGVVELGTANQPQLPESLLRTFGITASVHMALRRGGEIIGMQSAGYRSRTDPLTTPQRRIAQGIAHLASMALENARLFEQAESANRLKSDFIATISHELRTPLHIIMGYNDLLLDEGFGDLTAEQTDILKRMERSARELSELINAILDIGRLETGRLPVELRRIDLATLIEQIREETQNLQEEKADLAFSWRVAPALPPLYTDPVKLKVVLKNLLSNAVKFTNAGSVTVNVSARGSGVEVSVADTGIGLAPEELSIIFEPFRQVENPLTRRHGGVGLGLYIVRRMLELLSGTITVESTLGHGSIFRVWLPLTIAEGLTAEPAN